MSDSSHLTAARSARGQGAHSGSERLAQKLGWFSVGLGILELVAARSLCRAMGMQGLERLVQAYGARELATGAAILTSHDPTPWIYGRVAGDALDLSTLAAVQGGTGREVAGRAFATVAVAGASILDVVCARGLTVEKQPSPRDADAYRDRSGFPRPAASARGDAADFETPADYRIPAELRPWRDGRRAES